MLRKAIGIADTATDRIIAFVCLLLFLICLYAMVDAVHVYLGAGDRDALIYKPEHASDAGIMKDLNEDVVAWLTIEDTKIDYPVMQGKTNTEYLNKDCFGEYSLSGAIFLDFRNSPDFYDPYSLVYGHHLEYGVMFGALDEYLDRAYFDAHRTGKLITTAGETFRISFFACCHAAATEPAVFEPQGSADNVLQYIQDNSVIYEPDRLRKGAPVLGLSTCQGAGDLDRVIVYGTLRKTEPEEQDFTKARQY